MAPRRLTRENLLPLLELPGRDGLSPLDRFHARYYVGPPLGCWLWEGGLSRDGYGQLWIGGFGMLQTHQISYLIHVGDIPPGLTVIHSCDVPNCVNPDHLRLGTHLENMRDMSAKGRAPRCGGRTVLTADIVREARKRYANGERIDTISRSIAAHRMTVRVAILGKTWKHVTNDEVTA